MPLDPCSWLLHCPNNSLGQYGLGYLFTRNLKCRIILELNVTTGACIAKYFSCNPHFLVAIFKGQGMQRMAVPRGSAPPVFLKHLNFFLGLGHYKDDKIGYQHFFYSFSAHPPFQILQFSAPFTFPSLANYRPGESEGVLVQFATSMVMV